MKNAQSQQNHRVSSQFKFTKSRQVNCTQSYLNCRDSTKADIDISHFNSTQIYFLTLLSVRRGVIILFSVWNLCHLNISILIQGFVISTEKAKGVLCAANTVLWGSVPSIQAVLYVR